MELLELKKIMRDNGIVGCGGAGFPSYAKLDSGIDTLIINCAECEPLLRLHRQLIEKRTAEVLEAVNLIRETLNAKRAIVALKKAYTKAIESLNNELVNYSDIGICELKEAYPAGDEIILIYEATGRVVKPGALPKSVNVVVYNVETVYNLYRALKNKPVTHKYVTIAGEVKEPQTFYCPIGTNLEMLVNLAGGPTIENPVYLLGGPMMGTIGNSKDFVTKTTNAVILLPENHYVINKKRVNPKLDLKRAMAACCQCSYCTDMCPRHLLGHPIDPALFMRAVSNQDSKYVEPYINSMYCSGCGVCEMYACGQGLSPRTLLGVVKNSLRKEGIRPNPFTSESIVNESRDLRRVPLKRLRARLDLEKYNKSAPMVHTLITPDKVRIPLSGMIDKVGEIKVKVNDIVKENDLLIKADETKLSVNLHASIDGVITEITNRYIEIVRK